MCALFQKSECGAGFGTQYFVLNMEAIQAVWQIVCTTSIFQVLKKLPVGCSVERVK